MPTILLDTQKSQKNVFLSFYWKCTNSFDLVPYQVAPITSESELLILLKYMQLLCKSSFS